MNPIVYHVASGQSFYTGVGLLLIAASCAYTKHWLLHRVTILASIVGGIAIAISSTPLPYWFLALAIIVSFVWATSAWWSKHRGWAAAAFCAVWVAAGVWEASHLRMPHIPRVNERAVTIIGDSVTAGMGERRVETWPKILAREHDVRVQDLSSMGDKTSHARKRIVAQPIDAPLVFVEIGGNDVLGNTTAERFREELDQLLADLRKDNRQVAMFELPLPPFRGDFARTQRSLARKHGVVLVPKRIMLNVLAAEGATVDTIHLSPAGHASMAKTVWQLLQPAWE